MTMRTQLATAAALLLFGAPAAADAPQGHLDLYFVPSAKIELFTPGIGTGDDTGTGFGVKGMAPASDSLVFTGEYQAVGYDDAGDLDQMRFGVGFMGPRGGGLLVEYISVEEFIEADGFGAHLRLGSDNGYAQVGYLRLEDDFEESTGLEFAGGFAAEISPALGAFFDLRYTALEGEDSNAEIETTDIRIGLRFTFQR